MRIMRFNFDKIKLHARQKNKPTQCIWEEPGHSSWLLTASKVSRKHTLHDKMVSICILFCVLMTVHNPIWGAQWPSGRYLAPETRGREFKSCGCHVSKTCTQNRGNFKKIVHCCQNLIVCKSLKLLLLSDENCNLLPFIQFNTVG